MNALLKTSLVIAIIGAVNWGLVGIFNFNLVEFLFKEGSLITRIIYAIVFAAGLICTAILVSESYNPFLYFRFWGEAWEHINLRI